MSEPSYAVVMPSMASGPSFFEGASIGSIQGGNYYSIQGATTIMQNVYPHTPTHIILAKVIDDTVAMLETFIVVPVEFRSIHQEIVDKRTQGTGETFKARREVQDWKRTLNSFLWARGGPGAGKTYLASCVIEWLEALADEFPDMVVIFAYLRYTEQLTAWDIVLALVIQLVLGSRKFPEVAVMAQETFERCRQRKARPPMAELVKLFKAIVKVFPDAFITIDGIDEMKREIQDFIIDLVSTTNAHIIFTSRPSPIMEDKVKQLKGSNAAFIEVEAQPEDLDLYINGAIQGAHSLRTLLERHNMKDEVMTIIKKRAGGMFLHAALQVEMLQRCRTLRAIRETISHIPRGIDDLYAKSIGRIPQEDAGIAHLVFVWLLHAKGSLSIEDLQYAVATSPETCQFKEEDIVSEEDLVSICCGLIAVENTSRQVRLIHYTAQDALPSIISEYIPYPHNILVRTCIARLIDCGFQRSTIEQWGQLRSAFADNPLLHYAHSNAPYHTREAIKISADLLPWIETFVRGCELFPLIPHNDMLRFSKIIYISGNNGVHLLRPFHVAAYLGIGELLFRMATEEATDVNIRAHYYRHNEGLTSLAVAAIGGFEDIIELLLNIPGVDPRLQIESSASAIFLAAMCGHRAVLKRLLNVPNADINESDGDGWTMLILASVAGQELMVEALLEFSNIQVNHKTKEGHTALMLATILGHEAVVKLLFASPVIDLNCQDTDGWYGAMLAAYHGRISILKAFLDHPQSNVTLTSTNGSTILFCVLSYHSPTARNMDALQREDHDPQPTAQLLLDHPRTQPLAHIPNNTGRTPLMMASRFGYLSVVERILSLPGGNVNATDKKNETALKLALAHGHDAVVEVLRSSGAMDTDT